MYIVIVGGGKVGSYLAQVLLSSHNEVAIIEDNPHLSREALETAALYARTHPLVGRPGGRPWAKAA